jgi:hypothetical protein
MNGKSLRCLRGVRKARLSAVLLGVAVVLGWGLAAGVVEAAVVLAPAPDLNIGDVGLQYTAATEVFQAGGIAQGFTDAHGTVYALSNNTFTPGAFVLNALIDHSGNLLSGSFTINGGPTGWPAPLLAGNLTQVEFGSGSTMVFLFGTTGGAASASFGGVGGSGALEIHPGNSQLVVDFTKPFSSVSAGLTTYYDHFYGVNVPFGYGTDDGGMLVPEPAAVAIWGMLAAFGVAVALRGPRTRRAA